jgi:hypothetical protein
MNFIPPIKGTVVLKTAFVFSSAESLIDGDNHSVAVNDRQSCL